MTNRLFRIESIVKDIMRRLGVEGGWVNDSDLINNEETLIGNDPL